MHFLSEQINSSHKDESDTSYLSSVIGDACVLQDDRFLYVVKQTNYNLLKSEDARGLDYISRTEPNGQGRKTILVPTDQIELMCANFLHNRMEDIYEFEDEVSAFLLGACKEGLIFAINETAVHKQTLALWRLDSAQLEPLSFDTTESGSSLICPVCKFRFW